MYNEQIYYQSLLSSVWPEWKITKRLGKGSYGYVYEIQRDDLGTIYKCALKILRMETEESTYQHLNYTSKEYGENTKNTIALLRSDNFSDALLNQEKTTPGLEYPEEELEDFIRSVSNEIDLMMQLKGAPNIVSIEDYTVLRDSGSRTIMIRMELLESVDQYIKRKGFLDRDEIIHLGMDICTALEYCEQRNILHRDIKPSNIFYKDQIGFKLGDFGISRTISSLNSKMSMTGAGSPLYMAPEIYWGKKYDNTVDIYSLGIVLYILLNNNKPPLYELTGIDSDSSAERSIIHEANMKRLRGEPLPLPSNAEDLLGKVICKACDPDPAKRYQSASLFKAAIKEAKNAKEPPSAVTPTSSHPSYNRRIIAGIFAVAVGIVCILVYFAVGKESKDNLSTTVSFEDSQPQEQASQSVSYTVLSTDIDGATLNRQVKEGLIGETVTEYPSDISGYSCLKESESITLSDTDTENIIVFLYETKEYSYTVVCVDEYTGEQLESKTYYGEKGQNIVVDPPQIEGYYTEDTEVTVQLEDDDLNKIVRFSYLNVDEVMDIPSENVLHYNGHSYYVMRSSNIYSFWDAEDYCEERGGYLAIINDSSENEALYDFVFKNLHYLSAYFGYTDDGSEKSWYWVDNSSGGYENWLAGQPDNLNGHENYALFYYKDAAYKWNDGDFGLDDEGYVYFIIEWDA